MAPHAPATGELPVGADVVGGGGAAVVAGGGGGAAVVGAGAGAAPWRHCE